jgi:hypothetical protein
MVCHCRHKKLVTGATSVEWLSGVVWCNLYTLTLHVFCQIAWGNGWNKRNIIESPSLGFHFMQFRPWGGTCVYSESRGFNLITTITLVLVILLFFFFPVFFLLTVTSYNTACVVWRWKIPVYVNWGMNVSLWCVFPCGWRHSMCFVGELVYTYVINIREQRVLFDVTQYRYWKEVLRRDGVYLLCVSFIVPIKTTLWRHFSVNLFFSGNVKLSLYWPG